MPQEKATRSLKWLLLRLRPLLRLVKGFRGSPHAIAGGFSLGLFLAFTPTVGIQIIIAIFLASVFKLSRPAALVAVMVTNPLTIPPIFTFNYWVGSLFFDGPTVGEVYRHFFTIAAEMAKLNFWEVPALLRAFFEAGRDMLLPLTFGSLLVAVILGVVSYFILLKFLWFLIIRTDRKMRLREQRERKESK